jgi:fructan beta-fructosidase
LTIQNPELSPTFNKDQLTYSATVPFGTEEISVSPTALGNINIKVSATGNKGTITLNETEVNGGAVKVPLTEGENKIMFQTEQDSASGITTMLAVKRKSNPETYYTEKYRPQYHVTPESNWLNDPNGMVYYEGEYHLFYQYYPHGKFPTDEKHWAHVVSTDLVHWKEQPIALSPDQYGSIWSGSAVVDFNNSTGLFDDTPNKTGLVAYYTSTQGGNVYQRQCMAYSKDKGVTWIKYNNGAPVIDNSDDPLKDGAFRDPKVFWHEESSRWMMIVAGGPVRFYSSDDLINWKPEGMQPEIGTECADFYQLPVDGNAQKQKWVLSGGGVWYMIGDFKKVSGVWKFVPDTNERFDFNFGPDVYAAQTFSDVPGRRIKVDWMVDVGYCMETGNVTDPWNGAMTLPYEMELKTINGKVQLTQNPVKELDSLHTKEHVYNELSVSPESINPLKDLQLDKCEIRATIDIGTASEFGFKLRVGNNQYTTVKYNTATKNLTLDRSKSGTAPIDRFRGAYSARVEPINGKIQIQMFVDWSSLELFAQNGAYPFTALIFPEPTSVGMEFYSQGGTVTVDDMRVFELESIYREDKPTNEPTNITVTSGKNAYEIGEQFTVWAVPTALNASNSDVTWKVSNPEALKIVSESKDVLVIKALKAGNCSITASSKSGNITDTLNIAVIEKAFRTNLDGWSVLGGSWQTTTEGYEGIGSGNAPVFAKNKAGDFVYQGTFTYKSGNIGGALIFRASDDLSIYYTADICEQSRKARILKFHRNPVTGQAKDVTLGNVFTFDVRPDHTYKLRVEAVGNRLKFYIGDKLAVETTDSESLSGRFGLNVCDVTGVFQDVSYTQNIKLSGLALSSGVLSPAFSPNLKSYTASVSYQTDKIRIRPSCSGIGTVTINDKTVTSGLFTNDIPLAVGDNKVTIKTFNSAGTLDNSTVIVITRNKKAEPNKTNTWIKTNGKWYYFNSSGVMATGWVKVNSKWYYMNSSGILQTGWKKLSNKWYYLNSSGVMAIGWTKVSEKWYYMDSSGVMQTGWKKLSGKWYYFESNGRMVENASRKIGKKVYKFNKSGVCTNP